MNYYKKYVFAFFIFIVGLICGLVISQNFTKNNILHSQSIDNNQIRSTDNANSVDKSFLWLDFPMEYFSKDDVQWGSLIDGSRDDTKMTNYDEAAIKNIAVYQSYPTTNISIQSYSSEIVPLELSSPSQTQEQINKLGDIEVYKAQESYKKFGVLVSHYLPDNYIYDIKKFDVDNDGQDESIVSSTQTFTAGFGSYRTDIVKGNNVIFSIREDNSSIIPAETPNGFYIEWGSVGEFNGRCCEEGVKRTRFVYKDGQFTPLYEQEVRYLKIGKK